MRDHEQTDWADFTFIRQHLPSIEGWLSESAAYLTSALVASQRSNNWDGNVLEIGVWQGRYLSLLYHLTRHDVIGIDIFSFGTTPEVVRANFLRVFGSNERLKLITADSRNVLVQDLAPLAGSTGFSYISVDGGHSQEEVRHDLELSDALLGGDGIIAIDDFFNPHHPGVSEGVYRYFWQARKPGLEPFAYCGNKLFVARPSRSAQYRKAVCGFLSEHPELEFSREFNRLKKETEAWLRVEMLGAVCLIVSKW